MIRKKVYNKIRNKINKNTPFFQQNFSFKFKPHITHLVFPDWGHLSYFTIDLIDFFTVCLVLP